MNTKLHWTSSESQWESGASYIYISTVKREMSKMPCKKYLSSNKKIN
jgi:hypothetical protein